MEYCCSHDLQWCPGYKAWRTQKEAWCCQHKSLLCPQESGSAQGVVRKFSQRLSGTAAGHGPQPLATRFPVLASLLALAAVTGVLAAAATRCGHRAAARRLKASRTLVEEQAADDSFPESASPQLPLLEPERLAGAATPGPGSPAAAFEMEAERRH
jgi:hypothetical protein